MAEQKSVDFNISTLTIVKIILTLLILYFVYLLRDVLAILLISLILAILIDPLADWFEKKKISRTLAVLLVYVILIALISLIVVLLIPPLTTQFHQLTNKLPAYWEKLQLTGAKNFLTQYDSRALQQSFQSIEANLAKGIFAGLGGIFGSIISFFLVLVLTLYMVTQKKTLKKMGQAVIPAQYQPYLFQLAGRIKAKMGGWLKGQLILCLIIGISVFVGLSLMGVEYALVLGLIAGFLEIIPYIGPWIAAALATFIAFAQTPFLALIVIIFFVVLQQLENNFIVPKVMQKAVGLDPIISIVAIITGAKIAGFLGVLFAIPVASALSILLQDFFKENKEKADIK